jgi:hypothetical protein
MRALSDMEILDLWDRGVAERPLEQALLTLAAALPGVDAGRLADWPLGRRNRALLELRCACFGARIEGWLGCRQCGEKLELTVDGRALADADPSWDRDGDEPRIEIGAGTFALPTSRRLAGVLDTDDPRAAARLLVAACRLEPTEPAEWSDEEIERIGEEFARADPLAETRFELACPHCGAQWEESFDITAFLWAEIEAAANDALAAVHGLASAYGWSEASILSLSPRRRALYLEMAQA